MPRKQAGVMGGSEGLLAVLASLVLLLRGPKDALCVGAGES